MTYWVAGHITGGLGNRLFQHAAAMGLAEAYNHKVVFYLPQAAPTNHGAFENIFLLFPDTPVLTEEQQYITLPEPNGNVFTFTPFSDIPIKANLLVDGWRQTEKYFPVMGVHITFDKLLTKERQQQLLQKYQLDTKQETTCSIHFRFGDYKILPHHQIDLGTYVLKASKEFPEKTRFLVFSDEAKQYKTMLEEFVKTIGHDPIVVEEEDEIENIFLMSFCGGGAIVSNSTFSWWGAYFARQRSNNTKQYKACYPTVWGAGLPPARDIIPSWGTAVANS